MRTAFSIRGGSSTRRCAECLLSELAEDVGEVPVDERLRGAVEDDVMDREAEKGRPAIYVVQPSAEDAGGEVDADHTSTSMGTSTRTSTNTGRAFCASKWF